MVHFLENNQYDAGNAKIMKNATSKIMLLIVNTLIFSLLNIKANHILQSFDVKFSSSLNELFQVLTSHNHLTSVYVLQY